MSCMHHSFVRIHCATSFDWTPMRQDVVQGCPQQSDTHSANITGDLGAASTAQSRHCKHARQQHKRSDALYKAGHVGPCDMRGTSPILSQVDRCNSLSGTTDRRWAMDNVMLSSVKLLAKALADGSAQKSLHKTSLKTCDSSEQPRGLGGPSCNLVPASSTDC